MRRRVPALCVLLVLALTFAGAVAQASRSEAARAKPPAEPTAWTSYANDNQLRNSVNSDSLTRESVRRLSRLWTANLDGPIYASPLAQRVGGRQLLFVATEAGSVYALDASTYPGRRILAACGVGEASRSTRATGRSSRPLATRTSIPRRATASSTTGATETASSI